MHEKNMKFSLLLDVYGELLNDRKRELLEYYYNDDYSLSEISEITGISRQGIRDSIKKSEEEIYQLESKLGLAEKNIIISDFINKIETAINNAESIDKETISNEIEKLKSVLHS